MTPKISLITATVGAALVFAVPAWGDNWGADKPVSEPPNLVDLLVAKNGVVDSSIVVDRSNVSPDWFERAAAVAIQKQHLENMLNARERGLGVNADGPPAIITDPRHSSLVTRQRALEAREKPFDARSDGLNRIYGLGEYASPLVADDRFRIDHSNVPVPASAPSSGREIEWPQIGIGFAVGLALILGLVLTLKATHTRPFAH